MKYILYFLYVIAFITILIILNFEFKCYFFDFCLNDNYNLLSAFGILLSAFIASFSVQLNISHSKSIIEKQKEEASYFANIQIFNLLLTIFKTLDKVEHSNITISTLSYGVGYDKWHFSLISDNIQKVYSSIYNKDIFAKLRIQEQKEINEIFNSLYEIEIKKTKSLEKIDLSITKKNMKKEYEKILEEIDKNFKFLLKQYKHENLKNLKKVCSI